MTLARRQSIAAAAIVVAVVVIDQIIKFAVKTGMYLHESIHVTDWFQIVFTENNGMAFGMEVVPKLLLTSFRIVAVVVIAWYMVRVISRRAPWGYVVCLALIVAGAAGNIVDCLFYGMIFDNPMPPFTAQLVPWGEGYGTLMNGRVVDMFYFPLAEWNWPRWLPLCGGEHFIFFSPIFNFADSAISCGIVALLIFYHDRLQKL